MNKFSHGEWELQTEIQIKRTFRNPFLSTKITEAILERLKAHTHRDRDREENRKYLTTPPHSHRRWYFKLFGNVAIKLTRSSLPERPHPFLRLIRIKLNQVGVSALIIYIYI